MLFFGECLLGGYSGRNIPIQQRSQKQKISKVWMAMTAPGTDLLPETQC
jgi:hypothetical protein